MRTTLNLDDDVLEQARALAALRKTPFRQVVNEALRTGLRAADRPASTRPYHTAPRELGLKPGRDLDNIQELIAQVEGEEHR